MSDIPGTWSGTSNGVAFFAAPLLGDIVYKVTPRDPYLFAAIAIAFVAVAIAASLAPAFRAAGVDANTVLRGE